ncbi:hypothetical protein C1H46_029592 [Malus baccata]|uniref:Diphthamide synthase domain-containing protein n=1 Tax=Malus baccata TaxID=106549 RepID=A0A540LF11_MALBA|nr:hypothetical protein C1H46_029592 [Malus baccata]
MRRRLYGINVCGEVGEYETLTLDCPLFVNARIVLDEFQIILHSSDSIALVGVLHPFAFHLENKSESCPLGSSDHTNQNCQEKKSFLFEVQGDHPQRCDAACEADAEVENAVELADYMIAWILN